jgi:hypothetical protein
MITTIAQYRFLCESVSQIKFTNLHIDHAHQQDDYRIEAHVGDVLVAYADYSEYRGQYSIKMIEALVKGHGYGKAVMMELAKMYGYENITRGNFTEDGFKLRQKVDKELNFDYDKWLESQNKHLTREETIEKVEKKYPDVAKFMSDLCLFGKDAWEKLDRSVADCLEADTGLDLNDVADIVSWIKNSAINDNPTDAEVPYPVRADLEKLTK